MEISKRINAITIGLASPEDIRKWSYGEVKKPETINYRTLKPEKDGLFCERIFGPVKDWECSCGKYKRIRYKGVICDRCGVEVTKSITRRERMGHIDLACPVSHVWYFKGIPSPLALLLNVSPKNLEKILYFAPDRKREQLYEALKSYDITEDTENPFLENGVITETEYKIHKMYNTNFNAEILYRVKQTKIFPHKVGDIITNNELLKLQETFGKLFFTVEPDIPYELKLEEAEYGFSIGDIEVDVEEKPEIGPAKEEDMGKTSEIEGTGEDKQEKTEENYKILEIDGLISESKLNPLLDKEPGLAKRTTMAKRTVEESCYVVINPVNTNHKIGDTILESENRLHIYYNSEFKAGIGAEAIKAMLKDINLDSLNMELREELKHSSGQKAKKMIRRLQIIEAFRKSNCKPEWMILDALPVIPPDLRPMVQLEGGRFATSDLNDLYRRVINRNNRLKRLLELGAPDIIVKNEKRMLQEAVDALIDNGRRGHAVLGAGNRPLKSLSDLLEGKKGRFRQNLLGKRVDYSGRSVIVVGPKLRLYECGIPKKMALELFKPFVMHNLVKQELAHNIKTAKKLVEQESPEVWNILQEIVKDHPVLLNRAPTLHRLGIQVFKPILVEGNAIQLHPLACPAFNADFDGDQMAVHVPLSTEAQTEAEMLMLASNNVLSPANGTPIALPSQDIILGCYYLTMKEKGTKSEKKGMFANPEEAVRALEDGHIGIHSVVKVRVKGKIEETTIGRILFNQALPEDFHFVNFTIDKKKLGSIISFIYRQYGQKVAVNCLDDIKELGFHYATVSGITIGIVDLEIPSEKEKILEDAEKNVAKIREQFNYGLIMEEERIEKIINAWTDAADDVINAIIGNLSSFNPLYTMVESGARGSRRQIGQLAGMRGLMADPSGKIIEFPIRSNFREGLSCLEYFISTHGARKGLADTALRTSKSGYLTRRLIDVAQDLIITEEDCGTNDGVTVSDIEEDGNIIEKLEERIVGRVAQEDLIDAKTGEVFVRKGESIDEKIGKRIIDAGIKEVSIRSPLTCESKKGICTKCYGRDLASGQTVTIGEAVGTIAAQSIGEPGTQLTLRTFHTGGIKISGEDITLGLPRVEQLFEVRKPKKQAIISEINGNIDKIKDEPNSLDKEVIIKPETEILSGKNKEAKKKVYSIPKDLRIVVEEGQKITAGQKLTTGFIDPNDILRIQGIKAVQKYLLEQVQEVYRSQGVSIDDKHIEVIVRQIARLNKIYVKASRDSELLSGELVYVTDFEQANKQVVQDNEEIRNKNRRLLLSKTLINCVSGNKGDTLISEKTVIDESVINKIENSECLSFDVLDEQGAVISIVQGEINFIERIKDYVFIGDISEVTSQNKDSKGTTDTRVVDFEKLKGNIITKETALDLARNSVNKVRIYKPEISSDLIGKMLAQDIDIINQSGQNTVISANTILNESNIKTIIEQQYEKIEVWNDIKEINIKESLISIIRDDVIGKNLGEELREPETGNIIADMKQPVSKNIIRKAYSAGISDIPLEDGRFFSLEGRAMEYIYNNLIGKIIVQDILDKDSGEIMIPAGDKITKNNAQTLIQQGVEIVKYRTENSMPESISLFENIGFMRRIKLPAVGIPIIQGITQASLSTESFLSGASFQRTTHVLTNASIKGKIDYLLGLKENVIIGNIIPAGTGLAQYRNIKITSQYEEELEKETRNENALEIVAQSEQDDEFVSENHDNGNYSEMV